MATITASTATSSIVRAALAHRPSVGVSSSHVLGKTISFLSASSSNQSLPAIAKKGKVSCSMEGKPTVEEKSKGMSASLMAAVCAATISSPALALVDERLSTEGTGLPFGLSNNLLVWVLLGGFLSSGLSTLSTHPPSRRMRNQDCPSKAKLISVLTRNVKILQRIWLFPPYLVAKLS